MAKSQPRKPAAVAERRSAAVAGGAKSAPRRPLQRHAAAGSQDISGRLPEQLGARTQGFEAWARAIIAELRKVAWPTREEATKLTTVVIAISLVVGVFLGGVDAFFNALMHWFLQ